MKSVTIVYDIVDEAAFRDGGNPLRYEHHGLKADTVAAYDAVECCRIARERVQSIYELAGWQSDDEADPDDQSPEDHLAHINGLIRQECLKILGMLDNQNGGEK